MQPPTVLFDDSFRDNPNYEPFVTALGDALHAYHNGGDWQHHIDVAYSYIFAQPKLVQIAWRKSLMETFGIQQRKDIATMMLTR